MSVNNFPDCRCAGFNDACYVETATGGTVIPVAQKTLVSTTNFTVEGNTTLAVTPFLTNFIFATPATATSYDFFGFSGGTYAAGTVVQGNPAPGATVTITQYGSAATGNGVKALSVPATSGQNAVSFVPQVNMLNPNISTVWTGTATMNWSASSITLTSTISGSTANIVPNSVLYFASPPARCPSSLFITTNNGSNNYSFLKGTTDTTYFTNQTTPLTVGIYGANSRKFQGTITIVNGIASFTTTSGIVGELMCIITATATYIVGAPAGVGTFNLIGVSTARSVASAACFGVQVTNGFDIQYGTYISGVLTPQAFAQGALQNRTIAGGTGGLINISASATNTTPLTSNNGYAGQTQSTTNYNVGMVDFSVASAVSVNAQNYGGSTAVKDCANSGGVDIIFLPSNVGGTDKPFGRGGLTLNFYK